VQAGGGGLFSVAARWTAARPSRVEPAPTGISGGHGVRVQRKSHVGSLAGRGSGCGANLMWERARPAMGPLRALHMLNPATPGTPPSRVEPAPTGISGGHGVRVRRKSHVGAGSAHAESCDARHTAIAGRTRSHRDLWRAWGEGAPQIHVGAGSARDGALAGSAHAESCDVQHTAIAGRTRSHKGAPRGWFNQAPWHFLNFFSLPQGQGSLRPTSFNALRVGSWGA
jgi:hypothetical protein